MSTKDIFGWIATFLTVPIFAYPAAQLINVLERRLNYEKTPTFFIGIIYSNCLVCYIYGDLIFSQPIKTCSIFGCFISLLFSILYLFYENKKFINDAFINIVFIFTVTWAVLQTFTNIILNPVIVGKICFFTYLASLIYPLYLIYRVNKEKNYKLISLMFVEFSIASRVFWIIYAFLEKNNYIIYLNLLGVFIDIVLIIVRKNYKNNLATIGETNEFSSVEIEVTPNDCDTRKIESVNIEINEKNEGEEDQIKGETVKISPEKEMLA